jgi:UDP-N-acetylglucosamine acyltransferase
VTNSIHPTAIVDPTAVLGSGNRIGPYCIIGAGVVMGNDNYLSSHVVLGSRPEHRAFHDPDSPKGQSVKNLVIGSSNSFGEFFTAQLGTETVTRIGSHGFYMTKSNVGHDCQLADGITMAPLVILGGHVTIGSGANLGIASSVHQTVVIGAFAMVGMNSSVTKDVKPFSLVVNTGSRTVQTGLNNIGLERNGLDGDWTDNYSEYLSGKLPINDLPEKVQLIVKEWQSRK